MKKKGDLSEWVKDGVLLLNTILTVKPNKSNSHKNIGWERFTTEIIKRIDEMNNCVFIAMGKNAQKIICDNVKLNQIITVGHPSPLNISIPFNGCGCFKTCNEILKQKYKLKPIEWMKIFNIS